MARQRTAISVYAVTHFLVDFACAFLFFSALSDSDELYLCFLLYNFCAFALQMPLGLLADRLNRNAYAAAAGCVLVAAAYGLVGFPVAAAVTAGVGNSLFHLGGGLETLNACFENQMMIEENGATRRGRLSLLGVFVAPGAFGIFLGKLLGKQGAIPEIATVIVLLAGCSAYPPAGVFKRKAFRIPQRADLLRGNLFTTDSDGCPVPASRRLPALLRGDDIQLSVEPAGSLGLGTCRCRRPGKGGPAASWRTGSATDEPLSCR